MSTGTGRRAEYEAFVRARWPHLLRVAYLLTRDWAAGEDLVQTALVKVWFAWRRIDGDPEPYVRRTIVTTFLSQRRRRWRAELAQEQVPEPEPLDQTAGYGDRDALWRALGNLPAGQPAVVVLRYFEDLSEEQTAKTLRISVGTVKSQTSKALAKLRLDDGLRADVVPGGGTDADDR